MSLRFSKSFFVALLAAFLFTAAGNSYAFMPAKRSDVSKDLAETLPHSSDAERAVLGAILVNNGAALDVLPILRAEDFFLPQNRAIYRLMEEMAASGTPIDLVTLTDSLNRQGKLESAGGAGYVAQVGDGCYRAMNAKHYAQIVTEKSKLRTLISACNGIIEQAYQRGSSREIVEKAVEQIISLSADSAAVAKIREWNEAALSAVAELEAQRANPKAVFRLHSGITGLDEVTAGLRRKELTLIVGQTSHGKSLLAEEFAVTGDSDGHKGMIFSAEMSGESIAMRQLAYEADVFFFRTRRPEKLIDDEQMEKLRLAAKRERQIGIVDSGITPARVWALAEARKRSKGLDFIVVDYDQLVIGAAAGNSADPEVFFAKQGDFVIKAAEFAKRLDVAFILLAQPRKSPSGSKKDKSWRPTLDDIYGHSAMRNTPHVIMWVVRDYFLHGMDKKYENKASVHVLKSRNDKTCEVKISFDHNRVRFLDKQHGDEEES